MDNKSISKIDIIKEELRDSINTKSQILSNETILNGIQSASLMIVDAYKNGNKVLIAGNGGSAADAQHIAGELVSRFYFDRAPLSAIALTTDTSILTAIGNDYGYEDVFERQIRANGRKGDIFICISTSGNSTNILKGINAAKGQGILVLGMTGVNPSKMDDLCDILIKAPSDKTPRIQEAHITIAHIICGIVEAELFTNGKEQCKH